MSHTIKQFWTNSYQTSLETSVTKVIGSDITFKETIIFSESGGQEGDNGIVNGMPILGSRIIDKEIVYTLPENHGLKIGDVVNLQIDWQRRNKLMRLHFACELILVIMNRLFLKKSHNEELKPDEIDSVVIKTGAHMGEEGARIDFRQSTLQLDATENISKYFPQLQQEFNRIIDSNQQILTGYIDENTERRYWRIPGVAMVPCGGTHVMTTKEIGYVTLLREKTKDREKQIAERIKIKLQDPNMISKSYENQ